VLFHALVLLLKILRPLELIGIHRSVLLLPTAVGRFGNADVANRGRDDAAFGPGSLYLAERRDNLIRGVTSLLHSRSGGVGARDDHTHGISFRGAPHEYLLSFVKYCLMKGKGFEGSP
jgi:hypothetical protein